MVCLRVYSLWSEAVCRWSAGQDLCGAGWSHTHRPRRLQSEHSLPHHALPPTNISLPGFGHHRVWCPLDQQSAKHQYYHSAAGFESISSKIASLGPLFFISPGNLKKYLPLSQGTELNVKDSHIKCSKHRKWQNKGCLCILAFPGYISLSRQSVKPYPEVCLQLVIHDCSTV